MEVLEQITLAERIDIYLKGQTKFRSLNQLVQISTDLIIEVMREFRNNEAELLNDIDAQYKAYLSKYEQ